MILDAQLAAQDQRQKELEALLQAQKQARTNAISQSLSTTPPPKQKLIQPKSA